MRPNDGDYQAKASLRTPKWDYCPHLDFWTDGTDWVDAPEGIDNVDEGSSRSKP
jgi:hypothetical protein